MYRNTPWLILLLIFLFSCKKKEQTITTVGTVNAVSYSNGPTDSLKINQISILASHNSYHLKTDSAVFALLLRLNGTGVLPAGDNPNEIDYTHDPLTVQLTTYGLRDLELDVWNDPDGGHYYNRAAYYMLSQPVASNIPELLQPGFKIIHIPDFDFNVTNYTFVSAITEIKAWSDAHPNHLPLFINVETEVETVGDMVGTALGPVALAVPFDATAADNLDLEVKSVFGSNLNGVITPDNVRGGYTTLESAVLAGNWPKLAEARGKVIFIVNADGNSGNVYMAGHPSLQGRAMFVYTNPGTPEAAFVLENDPIGGFSDIQKYVAKGYIVRTMADEATTQARTGDYTKMNAAFGSWAQIVSTDYYRPDPRAGTPGWTNYQVILPGGHIARIDSISASDKLNLGVLKE